MYKTVYQEIGVEVDLDEWTDAELIEEMEDRGFYISKAIASMPREVYVLYEAYTSKDPVRFEVQLKELFYNSIGRIA